MRVSMLCPQCGSPAERCDRCAGALCTTRLCIELHDATCAGASSLPAAPTPVFTSPLPPPRPVHRPAPERDEEAERLIAEALVARISQHRQVGREALLAGDLDTALDELCVARLLEPELDRLGAAARRSLPADWEMETELTPLTRALSSRRHPRAVEAWRYVLDDGAARSIQAEAAEWLAQHAFERGRPGLGLRRLHVASRLGRAVDRAAFQAGYKQAGLDPSRAFGVYLVATRLDVHSARAAALCDPLTQQVWPDQDPRWWLDEPPPTPAASGDHQLEALHRATDLACSERDQGWLALAEGDYLAGPLGARSLGRDIRAGCAEAAEEDTFVRIRLAYERAADHLPDVAWPWYRLAELLAGAGFADRAIEHLAHAERRSLGGRDAERSQRPMLRALVQAGLGSRPGGLPTGARPFPAEPFGASLAARLGLR